MTIKVKEQMSTHRKAAIIVGVLYIIGTVAGALSLSGQKHVDSPDYLTAVSANENQIIIGALMILIMGFALATMSVVLYPILRKHNEALALGVVIFRGALEAVTYIVAVVCWLLLLALSQEYVKAGAPDASHFQTLGILLLETDVSNAHMMEIVFSLGALMINYVFYQSKLIPRWLSVWGLVGGILYLAFPLLAMFGSEMGILEAPLGVQEMIMALWLIVKGFNPSAIGSEPA